MRDTFDIMNTVACYIVGSMIGITSFFVVDLSMGKVQYDGVSVVDRHCDRGIYTVLIRRGGGVEHWQVNPTAYSMCEPGKHACLPFDIGRFTGLTHGVTRE